MTKVKPEKIRVRMAPSPTGLLHIGTSRTALFNWMFARHGADGKYILRIEDTDTERSTKEYEKDILDGLEWLGLKWDDLFRQSERIKYYTKHIQRLFDEGKAFWCYHTKEELETEQKSQIEKREPPRHICDFKLKAQSEKRKTNEGGIIRLAVDTDSKHKIIFEDIIKGRIEFEEGLLGDFSIAKSIDEPLYNFAVVVDDHMMEISHVIRGEDHISNTPKQILIFKALGWESPKYAHLPLILGSDRSKMSKRDGAVSVSDYKEKGYLPEALVNFLALLGWTPEGEREVITKNEMIEQFSLDKIHRSGAIFDIKKLNWLNNQYIRTFNDEGLFKLVQPFVEKYFGKQEKENILALSNLFRERLEYLDQVKEFHYFFKRPNYETELLIWKKGNKENALQSLKLIETELKQMKIWDETNIRKTLDKTANEYFEGDRGGVYWPFRAALSGEKYSADPVFIAVVLKKDEVLYRISSALKKLI